MKKSTFFLAVFMAAQMAHGQSVGIGTSSPNASAKLEVSSTTQGMLVPRMTTMQRTAISSPASGLLVFDLTTESFWYKGGSTWIELIDSVNTEVHRNGPSMIYTGMADNVGIGTSTPAYKLQVKTGEGYGISHTNGTIDVATYIQNNLGGFIGTKSNHAFQLYANDGLNQFLLTPSGRVGIGIANPDAMLEITRGTAPYGNLQVNGTNHDSHFNFGTPEDTYIRGGKPGARVLINDYADQGNVGIGTANPLQKLHVGGKLAVDNNVGIGITDPHAPLQFSNNLVNRKITLYESVNNDHQFFGFGVNPGLLRYQSTGDHVFFYGANSTTSNELMRIGSNGRVGIGITSPDVMLEITRGTAPLGTLKVDGTNYHTNFNSGALETTFIRGGKPGARVIINDYADLGNVGIGTVNPLQKLHVAGKLAVNNNVGFGITDPHAPLQFSNDVVNRKIVLYEGADNDHQYYGFGVNGSTLRYQVSSTSDNHIFYAGNTASTSDELMRISGNGNVDIAGSLEIGYIRIFGSVVNILGLSTGSASCNCPAGLVVIGGGFISTNQDIQIIKSYANGDSSWTMYAYNASVSTLQIQACAICARLAN